MPVQLLSFAELDGARLAACGQALFLVSTTGEGDAPDTASGFTRKLVSGAAPESLRQLRFGILALGDAAATRASAPSGTRCPAGCSATAQPLFDMVEVDNGDPRRAAPLAEIHLSALGGGADCRLGAPALWPLATGGAPPAQPRQSRCAGLAPRAGAGRSGATLAWTAGDIAEVGPCQPRTSSAKLLVRLSSMAPPRCAATAAR